MTPETIANALGRALRKTNGGYMAQCPCHDDTTASLSLDESDGKILLKCFAGCDNESIINTLKSLGLWPKTSIISTQKKQIVAKYDYGQYVKLRYEPKSFGFQHTKDGKTNQNRGCEPLPYRLVDIKAADTFVVVEGEKDADNLAALGIVATTLDSGASSHVPPTMIEAAKGKHIILMPDNDQPGRQYVDQIGAALEPVAASVMLLELPGLAAKQDISDWLNILGNTKELLMDLMHSAPKWVPENTNKSTNRIRVVSVLDFMQMDFPPRETLLAPWLPSQGLAMVYAPRGLGKTHFSLGAAYAIASGSSFLGWTAQMPRGVLFVDGEMPASALQERITRIAASNDKEPVAKFQIVTPDMQDSGMINLSDPEDQSSLQPYLEGIDVIILDNLSTLCRSGKESEGEAWLPVQQWALQQRAAGRSVLFIHHAGKNGEQRGSSRREDVLDTVVALKRPCDYTQDMGACFEVHFEKARGLYGDQTKPFEARLMNTPDGLQTWKMIPLEDSTAEKVAKLINEGVPQNEIADLLGIAKGTVSKAKQKAVSKGLIK